MKYFARYFKSKLSLTREMNKLLKMGYKIVGDYHKGLIVVLESEDKEERISLYWKA